MLTKTIDQPTDLNKLEGKEIKHFFTYFVFKVGTPPTFHAWSFKSPPTEPMSGGPKKVGGNKELVDFSSLDS